MESDPYSHEPSDSPSPCDTSDIMVRLFQELGEYVVTFPYGYHFGFNVGFNVNEAVSFGTEAWIDVAKVSGLCTCGLVH